MLITQLLKLSKLPNCRTIKSAKVSCFSTSKNLWNEKGKTVNSAKLNQNLKYNEWNQEESQEILDIYKERLKYSPLLEEQEIEEENKFSGLNLSRGVFGVYDIEDLVETLRHQNSEDIFVAMVPKEINYVDYIVAVSGRSQRHMTAIAHFVYRLYKHKRHSSDIVPKLEGKNSPDWMALDLGNIALHIFSRKARLKYDLDSLWAVGPKYDAEFNRKELVSSILERHSIYLEGLEPET